MNIVRPFLDQASLHPHRIAIHEGEKSISFGELKKEVIATAANYSELGIKTGDRVLVAVPMSIDLYRSVLALFFIGAVAVFVDEWVSVKRLNLLCIKADCKGLLATKKIAFVTKFFKGTRAIPIKLSLKQRSEQPVDIYDAQGDEPALITFTTGSTGEPKAANRTHNFLKSQFDVLLPLLNIQDGEVDLPVLPIVLFINLGGGRTSVIVPWKPAKAHKLKTGELISTLERRKVTSITASPSFLRHLAEGLQLKGKTLKLKSVFTGGAPVFPEDAKLFNSAFGNTKTTVIYGSTEAEPISMIDAESLAHEDLVGTGGLKVGDLHPETEIVILKLNAELDHVSIKDDFSAACQIEGEIGEICVAGKHVLKNYYKSEEAFKENKILVEGKIWHKTGDTGFIQENQLFLVGRCKEIFEHKGTLFLPFVLEHQLLQVAGIKCGTVILHNGQVCLCYEGVLSADDKNEMVNSLGLDKVISLKKIPMDKRHHSKIDYAALRKKLK